MPQNVVLLTIDSLRAERFLRPGALDALDNLDRVASGPGGVRFSRAFATGPGTTPSFPGILTGTLPLSQGGWEPMRDERPFLARTCADAGLATGGFTSNPFLSSNFNYDTGFDRFSDYQNPLMGIATRLFPRGIEVRTPALQRLDDFLHFTTALRKGYELVAGKSRPYVPADVITDDTIAWLNEADEPFFCWSHYMDVHHPCFPPAEYRERFDVPESVTAEDIGELYSTFVRDSPALADDDVALLERIYDAAIDYVDDQIGRILDTLKRNGVLDDTLVVITSDHGELFGEHDEYAKPERLYDELLHVPLIVGNAPDAVKPGRDDLVSLLDVPAMIRHALDIQGDDDGAVPGVDPARDCVLAEHKRGDDVIVGARGVDYRFEVDRIRGEERIYRLNDGETLVDPGTVPAEVLATLRERVNDRLAEIDLRPVDLDLDDDVEGRLEDLGYL